MHINRYETTGGWRNGSAFPAWDFETATGAFRGGIMICYDREVPESARLLMLQGVDVTVRAKRHTLFSSVKAASMSRVEIPGANSFFRNI